MTNGEPDKRQIVPDLVRKSTEALASVPTDAEQEYGNFDNFTQRSSQDEVPHLSGNWTLDKEAINSRLVSANIRFN